MNGWDGRKAACALVVTSATLALVSRSRGDDGLVHAFPRSGLVSRFGLKTETLVINKG